MRWMISGIITNKTMIYKLDDKPQCFFIIQLLGDKKNYYITKKLNYKYNSYLKNTYISKI